MESAESRSGGLQSAGAIWKSPFLVLCLSILPAVSSFAGARHFTYLYEAVTSPPGSVELENTITWAQTAGAARLDKVDFREELEIGITNHFQLGLYPLDWNYRHGGDEEGGFNYDGGAVELIYNLTNPVVDPIGLSLYQEYKGGDRLFEWESKLIAQKNFGPLIFAYNATLEAVWEGKELTEREGEFQQAVGTSYEISPRISVGLEFLHEFVFPEWRDHKKIRNVFIGPNVSYRHQSWFVTVTALAQATDTPGEADFQLRTIFGFGF